MDFNQLLHFACEHNASDVHIQGGLQPRLRVGGIMRVVNLPAVTDDAGACVHRIHRAATHAR